MAHRNTAAHPARRDERDTHGTRQPEQQQQRFDTAREGPRGGDEYHVDPFMVGNNTYRDSDRANYNGPGYYGGGQGARDAGNYEGAGYWDSDYDRAQRGNWHADDYRQQHYGQLGPRNESRGVDSSYSADQRRDLSRGDRPAGGYGSYGSSDGAYGDVQRSTAPQYGQSRAPYDPDYHRWRTEQMNKLDNDYHSWRSDRYKKFSDEFNSWRDQRNANDTNTDPATGVNHDIEGTAKPADSGKQK